MALAGEEHECVLQGEMPGDPLKQNIRQNASLPTAPEVGNVQWALDWGQGLNVITVPVFSTYSNSTEKATVLPLI